MPYRKLKPQPNEKTHRNELIREYAQQHTEVTLEEIGHLFALSKQRVGKILQRGRRKEDEVP